MTTSVVTSNGAPIPFTARYFGPLRETDGGSPDGTLRARYAEDGYVFLRRFLPEDAVVALRQAYLTDFAQAEAPLPRHGVPGHPAHGFVRTPAFRTFVEQPAFARLAARISGAQVAPIRRTPLRHFIPGSNVASRAHIDGTYINGTPTDVVTIWVPLGACPVQAGSLMYLEGSHADAALAEESRKGAPLDRVSDARPITHDLKWLSDTTGRRWLASDFAAGDVVVHSPAIVHATLDATAGVRVSVDVRFRRVDGPADPRWDDDWSADDGY